MRGTRRGHAADGQLVADQRSMKPHVFAASEQPTGNRSSRLRELDHSRPDVVRTLETMVSYPESELADAGTRPPPRAPSLAPPPVILRLGRRIVARLGGTLRGLAEREQNQRLQVDGPRFEPDPPVKPEDDDGGEARAVSTRRRVSEPLVCYAGYQTSGSMKPQILAASEQPTGNRSSRLRQLDQSRPDMIRTLETMV